MAQQTSYGKRIRMLRKTFGWTIRELAKRAGKTAATIKRIEAGESCNVETLERIAKAFDVRPASFLEPLDEDD